MYDLLNDDVLCINGERAQRIAERSTILYIYCPLGKAQANKEAHLEVFRVFLALRLVEFQCFGAILRTNIRCVLKSNSCRFLKEFEGLFFK